MNIQDVAINTSLNSLFSVVGVTVDYKTLDGAISTETSAIVGKTTHEIDTDVGILTKETRDYIFKTTELNLIPTVGDKVEETIGDELYIYEVHNPSGNDAWYHPDPQKQYIRVHTQLVDTQ